MNKGLINIQWEKVEEYSEEEITYFLFVEGKTLDAICKIRNINKETAKRHIIEGKIKYGILAKSENEEELLKNISRAGKGDKLEIINSLEKEMKSKLISYIKNNYVEMYPKEKETAIWIIGELKEISCNDILLKSSVHKFVNVRRMAISAMGKIGDKSLELPLMRALDDENPQVVLYAINGLIKIKSEKAYDKINNILVNTSKEYIKRAALRYMDEINSNGQGE
ncbi:HEAT repeat domain-containing protein [Clostridium sp. MSJ-11]|uniref:HEAT repeat domain-containing protein n=1 Tax=Clostridium mobile TaxID=2841512 RepID=A0ABS6EKI2_9CLOT|nr:HEAT repeat domain-containing protein [Clostridium mobile]MBU5485525.1 HEAT repeat domain-containing protein [Clostridium mobile]